MRHELFTTLHTQQTNYVQGNFQVLIIAILVLLFTNFINCESKKSPHRCNENPSCGNIHNISYPFRLKGQPDGCGEPKYELVCENNTAVLYIYSGKYHVQAINRKNLTIRLVDAGVDKHDCSSLPLHSLSPENFSSSHLTDKDLFLYVGDSSSEYLWNGEMLFLSCRNPVHNSSIYANRTACNNSNRSVVFSSSYSYVLFRDNMEISVLEDLCRVDMIALYSRPISCKNNCSYSEVHDALAYGFELSWRVINCEKCKGRAFCLLDDNANMEGDCTGFCGFQCILSRTSTVLLLIAYYGIVPMVLIRFVIGWLLFMGLLIYKWRRRHLSVYDTVEEFLQHHNNLRPIKYSFSNIKSMTKGFKEKLGEGGYGSVYKGKLRSGGAVAVKVLSKSKANGQDFINEVGTIGRIHHVNVVRLIGFCAEGSKRALVYEFMPNGSLEKHIFPRKEGNGFLSCEKMYKISLGVARGIEYLHRGCDMRILHFDIKPHNILLDDNFVPKVSDFGLAKLYPADGSIASLTAVRGTIGYIAPELFYKSIGAVSYKADVYSFGMLLMEMAGRRKMINAIAENSSQIYYPSWVYDQISKGKDIEILEEISEEETKIARKMIIVAFWCIQMRPSDRPSMNKVIEMLQGEVECLQMPPKPSLYPEDIMVKDMDQDSTNLTSSSMLSRDSSESISFKT